MRKIILFVSQIKGRQEGEERERKKEEREKGRKEEGKEGGKRVSGETSGKEELLLHLRSGQNGLHGNLTFDLSLKR